MNLGGRYVIFFSLKSLGPPSLHLLGRIVTVLKIFFGTELGILYVSEYIRGIDNGERMRKLVLRFFFCKFSLENVRKEKGEKKLDLGNKVTFSQSTDLSKLIYGGTNF